MPPGSPEQTGLTLLLVLVSLIFPHIVTYLWSRDDEDFFFDSQRPQAKPRKPKKKTAYIEKEPPGRLPRAELVYNYRTWFINSSNATNLGYRIQFATKNWKSGKVVGYIYGIDMPIPKSGDKVVAHMKSGRFLEGILARLEKYSTLNTHFIAEILWIGYRGESHALQSGSTRPDPRRGSHGN